MNITRPLRPLLAVTILLLGSLPLPAQEPQQVTLREHLGVGFAHELVYFKVPGLEGDGWVAAVADDKPVPVQLLGDGRIALVTDLAPLEERIFVLTKAATTPATDLRLGKSADEQFLEIRNAHLGVRLAATREAAQRGPVAGICLRDGKWNGGSTMTRKEELQNYSVTIRQSGPVFAEAVCRYDFGDAGSWEVTVRVITGEPAILLSERCSLGPKTASLWQLALALPADQPVNSSLYRVCVGSTSPRGSHHLARFPHGGGVALTAWYTWWSGTASPTAAFFHLPKEVLYLHEADGLKRATAPEAEVKPDTLKPEAEEIEGLDDIGKTAAAKTPELFNDALVVAVGRPALWARDGENGIGQATMPANVGKDGLLHLALPLNRVGREWLIGTGKVKEVLVPDAQVALPQKLYAKHLGTSLAMIQEMKLDWDAKITHPSLLFPAATYENYPLELVKRATMLWGGRGVIENYYFDRAPGARQKGAEGARQAANEAVGYPLSWFLPRPGSCRSVAENQAPHELGQALYRAAGTADFILGTEALSPAQQKVLRARLAFLCYRASDPSVINHKKGLRNFPNMSIFTYIGVGMTAMVIADHPDAAVWTEFTASRMERDLRDLSGPNGGWSEAPHYQGAGMDGFLWFGLAARQAGLSEVVYDQRLRRAIRFLAKLSTPPDPRFDQRREIPPIGNTYLFETSSQFGALATIWKEKDPEFAETMQWIWQQQGSPENMGVGGDAGIHWHMHMLLDRTWKATRPLDLSSEVFPNFGAVLRSNYPSDRETYLLYHVGPWLYHYDNDMGTFILWGRGRLLSNDWGYNGCMPAWQHNRVSLGGSGKMAEANLQTAADYLHGVQAGWHRQILFVKDPDPKGPSWFLLRDWLEPKTNAADWWYWLYTPDPPSVAADVLHQQGMADIDCDIWFGNSRAREFPRLTNAEWATQQKDKKAPVIADPGELADDELVLDDEGPNAPKSPSPRLRTTKLTISCPATGKRDDDRTTQHGLNLKISPEKPIVWALWPRDAKEKPPAFTTIADGQGLKVVHAGGIDYAFLAPQPITWKDGDVSFSGTVGTIQVRGQKVILTLNAEGQVQFGKHELKADAKGMTKEF